VIDDNQFLIMDFIPGENLEEILKKQGSLPLNQVMQWAEELGSALMYMHSQTPTVIHRDIKPANIKLSQDGEAVLVDFGIAKAASSNEATTTGAIGFTPGFAPPEQYGTAHTGPYTDQFALAATLYALLTGQRPADSMLRSMQQAEITPLRKFDPAIPVGFQNAILRALSLNPVDRFPNVAEFVKALQSSMRGYKPPKQGLKRKFTAPSVVTPPANLPNALTVPSKRPRSKIILWLILAFIFVAIIAVGAFLLLPKILPASPSVPTLTTTFQDSQTVPGVIVPTSTTTSEPTSTQTLTSEPSPTLTATITPFEQGAAIAYVTNKGDGKTFQVWLMTIAQTADGTFSILSDRQLTSDEGDKSQPAWSPDGKKLLYVGPSGGSSLGKDVFVLDLSDPTSFPMDISNLQGDDFDPAWSPDGSLVAFTNQGRFGTDIQMLYLVDADGKNPTHIVSNFRELEPSWTPDMEYIVYVIFGPGGHRILYLRDKMNDYQDVANRNPVQFDTRALGGRQGEISEPAVSPDGTWIAYARNESGMYKIYLMKFSDRGNYSKQLTNSAKDTDPAWSPDSQWLLFTSNRDGNAEIYIMDLNGENQVNLTHSPWTEKDPAWQPFPTSSTQ
jgi:Tol biopolymer transport system component